MKKTMCILMAMLLLALCGCSGVKKVCSNDLYGIYENEGEYFLRFHKEDITVSNPEFQAARPPVKFTYGSVASMKKAIETADFTTDQLDSVIRKANAAEGKLAICNLDKLYDVVLPEGEKLAAVRWFTETYSFSLKSTTLSGSVSMATMEDVAYFEDMYGFDPENTNITILSQSTEAERNATVVVYELKNDKETWKSITYTYTADGKTMTIVEQYHYDVSETVPQTICFWGDCDGVYFTGQFAGFTERPSYEWVTSFGLKPYVETETE